MVQLDMIRIDHTIVTRSNHHSLSRTTLTASFDEENHLSHTTGLSINSKIMYLWCCLLRSPIELGSGRLEFSALTSIDLALFLLAPWISNTDWIFYLLYSFLINLFNRTKKRKVSVKNLQIIPVKLSSQSTINIHMQRKTAYSSRAGSPE